MVNAATNATDPPLTPALALRLVLWATARVEPDDDRGWVVVDETGRYLDDRARLLGRSPIGRGISSRLIDRHGPIAQPVAGQPAAPLRFTTRAQADALVADQRRRAAWLMLTHLEGAGELDPPGTPAGTLYRSLGRAWPARVEAVAPAEGDHPTTTADVFDPDGQPARCAPGGAPEGCER